MVFIGSLIQIWNANPSPRFSPLSQEFTKSFILNITQALKYLDFSYFGHIGSQEKSYKANEKIGVEESYTPIFSIV